MCSVGNLETLKTIPEKENINVHERLRELYDTCYSSNTMKLVLQGKRRGVRLGLYVSVGRESLDELEGLAKTYFSDVPNKSLKTLYDPSEFDQRKYELGECFLSDVDA